MGSHLFCLGTISTCAVYDLHVAMNAIWHITKYPYILYLCWFLLHETIAGVRLTFQTYCHAIRINSETCIADKIIL
jgi:hypothetical protein